MKAPFPYFGGKSSIAPVVWDRFGDVQNYVEPFFGSGAVLLARPGQPGTETVNDTDGLLVNFWRAVQRDPETVAGYADWPVSECDLHSRHLWLVNEGKRRVERLKTNPDFYDTKAAGYWVWGLCQWIGSGWCSGKGPHRLPEDAGELHGVHRNLPHLGDAGTGVHRNLPHLGNAGRGICRALDGNGVEHKRPHLMTGGKGIHTAPGVSNQMPNMFLSGVCARGGANTCAEHRARLIALFSALSDRLRRVRICCGDWSRVLGPSVTEKHGITGIFLDPPYGHAERERELYTVETDCAPAVRTWAMANGGNPLLRIALCGYEAPGYEMPASWETYRWKARGGYGSQSDGRGRENAKRETVWFSPACIRADVPQTGLFAL